MTNQVVWLADQRSSSSEEEKMVGQVLSTEQDISVEEEMMTNLVWLADQRSSSEEEEEKTAGQVLSTEQDISVKEEEEMMTNQVLLTDQGFSSSEEEKMASQVLSMEQGSSSSYCFLAFFKLFIKMDLTNIKACSESKAIKWYVDQS